MKINYDCLLEVGREESNPFLGSTINKWKLIPGRNQRLENFHVVNVDSLEEVEEHLLMSQSG